MNYPLLFKILMEWGLIGNEYEIVLFLYTEFKVGIPITYTYSFPEKCIYSSVSDFINSEQVKYSNNEKLTEIMKLFKRSKYDRLDEWDGLYGYRLK